ncbi:50S ribosomal protein L3 [candidate division WOR-3 bacterium JGI_Cruoil_03_44_89]|uniref:Large ribosomal subunit protein uL3 n=1 Tax=candidate division WOR-3 bacterium JGI_Cruoil_03_44_89 TaxID=1973748 RepID=A0A235BPN6_UNCW3|nr:MAG: 50S ribosomal protein L3 [candidate division WOR-3 bacterium JGI_Cruoil_03_44_89]
MKAILGKKIEMTQVFDDNGNVIPVTVVRCNGNSIVGIRTRERDGYNAVILGYGVAKHPNLPHRGIFKKMGIAPVKIMREIRKEDIEGTNIGGTVPVSQFEVGEKVFVTGVSKGKGFQGPIKRWGFTRGPMSHGSKSHRVQGSIGASADPARVWKGKKMAGRMGGVRVTLKNVSIVKIDDEQNLIYLKGAVPGTRGSFLVIKR